MLIPEDPEMDRYFGPNPHFRFTKALWPGATDGQRGYVASRAPLRLSAEDRFHYLERRLPLQKEPFVKQILNNLYRVCEQEGPFDGIFGYSEGATVAATFVIDYLQKCSTSQIEMLLKCAVFMNGSAPYAADGGAIYLADRDGEVITIPTCHILAHNDGMLSESLALFNICRQDRAVIVDHGRGHVFPTEPSALELILHGFRHLATRTREINI